MQILHMSWSIINAPNLCFHSYISIVYDSIIVCPHISYFFIEFVFGDNSSICGYYVLFITNFLLLEPFPFGKYNLVLESSIASYMSRSN
jgi:hypothetical protein